MAGEAVAEAPGESRLETCRFQPGRTPPDMCRCSAGIVSVRCSPAPASKGAPKPPITLSLTMLWCSRPNHTSINQAVSKADTGSLKHMVTHGQASLPCEVAAATPIETSLEHES